jgi:hypothetical protein
MKIMSAVITFSVLFGITYNLFDDLYKELCNNSKVVAIKHSSSIKLA